MNIFQKITEQALKIHLAMTHKSLTLVPPVESKYRPETTSRLALSLSIHPYLSATPRGTLL